VRETLGELLQSLNPAERDRPLLTQRGELGGPLLLGAEQVVVGRDRGAEEIRAHPTTSSV